MNVQQGFVLLYQKETEVLLQLLCRKQQIPSSFIKTLVSILFATHKFLDSNLQFHGHTFTATSKEYSHATRCQLKHHSAKSQLNMKYDCGAPQ